MGDVIPGKGRNRYTNFIMYLAGFETLKTKSKTQMDKEQNNVEIKSILSAPSDKVVAPP